MFPWLRILPVTIVATALLLGLKIGGLMQGGEVLLIGLAEAQAAKSAKEPSPAPGTAAPKDAPPKEATATEGVAKEPVAARDPATFSRSEIELLAKLAERREELEGRARELDMREKLLQVTEKRVEERIGELKKLEAQIRGLIRQHDEEEEKNLKSLVKVYENMKPKTAARIFEKLDMTVLLVVVERMKEAKLAPVLAEMDPARAQRITVELATRRQLPGASGVRTEGGNG